MAGEAVRAALPERGSVLHFCLKTVAAKQPWRGRQPSHFEELEIAERGGLGEKEGKDTIISSMPLRRDSMLDPRKTRGKTLSSPAHSGEE